MNKENKELVEVRVLLRPAKEYNVAEIEVKELCTKDNLDITIKNLRDTVRLQVIAEVNLLCSELKKSKNQPIANASIKEDVKPRAVKKIVAEEPEGIDFGDMM